MVTLDRGQSQPSNAYQLFVRQHMPVLPDDRDVDPAQLIFGEARFRWQTQHAAEFENGAFICVQHLCQPVRVGEFPIAPDEKEQPTGELLLQRRHAILEVLGQ